MLMLLCTALTFCPVKFDFEHPSCEEAVVFIEQNPLPAFLIDLKHQAETDKNLFRFILRIEKENIKNYQEDADPKWRAVGLFAGFMHWSPGNLSSVLEALTDESPIEVAPPYDDHAYRLNDLVWGWLDIFLAENINITDPEKRVFDQNTREKIFATLLCWGNPQHREQLLLKHQAPHRFHGNIRDLVLSGEPAALPALARFGDHRDAHLIATYLSDTDVDNPAWLAAALLPDPSYFPYLSHLTADRLLPGAAEKNHQPLFVALAAQNHERSRLIAETLIETLDGATPDETKLLWDLFAGFTKHQTHIKYHETLVLKMVRRRHIINTDTFEWFANKDASLAEELCRSIFSTTTPIYQDPWAYERMAAWFRLNGTDKDQDLSVVGEHRVLDRFPKRQHPHVEETWK